MYGPSLCFLYGGWHLFMHTVLVLKDMNFFKPETGVREQWNGGSFVELETRLTLLVYGLGYRPNSQGIVISFLVRTRDFSFLPKCPGQLHGLPNIQFSVHQGLCFEGLKVTTHPFNAKVKNELCCCTLPHAL